MRILYVDQTGKLGGGELAILPWICHAREGAEVALLEDGPFRGLLEQHGIPVHVFEKNGLNSIRRESGVGAVFRKVPALLDLRHRLAKKASAFDVVYANSQKAFFLSAISRRRHQPLVWHLRDIMSAEHFSPFLRMIAVRFGNWFASVIIANSNATADSFVAAGGSRSKVRVVHDGVSAEPFTRVTPEEISSIRLELGSPNALLVGHFGRISPWKGQHVLLESIRNLPQFHAVLVGDALFGETSYADRLRKLASSAELRGRVHFLGFRRDIPALMMVMDVIAHTSTSPEPFGLVIVEAMLAGKPIVASAAGGALEILQDSGQNFGLLTVPGSVRELNRCLVWLVDHPRDVEQLTHKARQRAEAVFSQKPMFEALTSILRDLERDE